MTKDQIGDIKGDRSVMRDRRQGIKNKKLIPVFTVHMLKIKYKNLKTGDQRYGIKDMRSNTSNQVLYIMKQGQRREMVTKDQRLEINDNGTNTRDR